MSGELIQKCESTQEEIKKRLANNESLPGYYWVQALEQTAGRGRQGHVWVSTPGNFYFSFLLKGPVEHPTWIPHRVALSMRKILLDFGLDPTFIKLKWPNDLVWTQGQKTAKLSGLIVEKIGAHFVVGVGLNLVHSPQVPEQETIFLHKILNNSKKPTLDEVREEFLKQVQHEFSLSGQEAKSWKTRYESAQLLISGQELNWEQGQGCFLRIGDYGELIVQLPNGQEQALYSEEIKLKKT